MDKHSLIRRPDVEARTGLRRSSLYDLVAAKRFPAPIRIAGTRTVAWVEAEVDQWVKDQIEAARGSANP
jgi:prophage regulatory protein